MDVKKGVVKVSKMYNGGVWVVVVFGVIVVAGFMRVAATS